MVINRFVCFSRRRRVKIRHNRATRCDPRQQLMGRVSCFCSAEFIYLTTLCTTGDMMGLGVNGRRISLKSCSDSSLDGRSSDSTYTNSSGGFECCGCGAATGGRWRNSSIATTKLPMVEKLNVNGTGFARQSYRNPYDEMTNYTASNKSHLNSTYPKLSYSFYHKKSKKPISSQGEFINELWLVNRECSCRNFQGNRWERTFRKCFRSDTCVRWRQQAICQCGEIQEWVSFLVIQSLYSRFRKRSL